MADTSQDRESKKARVEIDMEKRADEFLKAMKDPLIHIGDRGRIPDPDFVAPEPKFCERFEQLNKEEDNSTTEYETDPTRKGCVRVQIHIDGPE